METLLFLLIVVAVLGIPIVLGGVLIRKIQRRIALRRQRLAEEGPVAVSHLPVLLGLMIGWLGLALLGAGFIPLLVWLFDRDSDARRAAITMAVIVVVFELIAAAVATRGLRVLILSDDGLVEDRPRRRRVVPYGDITAVRAPRRILGSVRIERHGGRALRLPGHGSNADEFVSALVVRAPQVDGVIGAHHEVGDDWDLDSTSVYSISRRRIRTTIGGLAVAAVLMVMVPAVFAARSDTGSVGDAIGAGAIGLLLWSIIAGAAAVDLIKRGQPIRLVLAPGRIEAHLLRGGTRVWHADEIVAVTIDTHIVRVRGIPGWRRPAIIDPLSGDRMKIDEVRARHFGTSTMALVAECRARYHVLRADNTPAGATPVGVAVEGAKPFGVTVDGPSESAGTPSQVDELRRVVAAAQTVEQRRALLEIGDLQRRSGQHAAAIVSYRAYLDDHPDDAVAWEALAESLRAARRTDEADEATQAAQDAGLRR